MAPASAAPRTVHRLFFALWPTTDVADRVHAVGRQLAGSCGGRLMQRDSVHLTLAFLGNVTDEQRASLLEVGRTHSMSACELVFDTLGRFGRKSLIWAGCSQVPAALAEQVRVLHERLRAAGFPLDERDFVPHVTLLRNARCTALPILAEPIVWPATEWRLVESLTVSGGASYRPVESWAMPEQPG